MMTALSASSTSCRRCPGPTAVGRTLRCTASPARTLGMCEQANAIAELGERSQRRRRRRRECPHGPRRRARHVCQTQARQGSRACAPRPSRRRRAMDQPRQSHAVGHRRARSGSVTPAPRICVRITLVVPLITQSSAEMRSPRRLVRSSAMIGSPAPTARLEVQACAVLGGERAEPRAGSCDHRLVGGHDRLAGTQRRLDQRRCRVGATHRLDHDRHGRVGDHGRGIVDEADVLQVDVAGPCDMSRTAATRSTGVAPARSPSNSHCSMSRRATATPTVPSPSNPMPTDSIAGTVYSWG